MLHIQQLKVKAKGDSGEMLLSAAYTEWYGPEDDELWSYLIIKLGEFSSESEAIRVVASNYARDFMLISQDRNLTFDKIVKYELCEDDSWTWNKISTIAGLDHMSEHLKILDELDKDFEARFKGETRLAIRNGSLEGVHGSDVDFMFSWQGCSADLDIMVTPQGDNVGTCLYTILDVAEAGSSLNICLNIPLNRMSSYSESFAKDDVETCEVFLALDESLRGDCKQIIRFAVVTTDGSSSGSTYALARGFSLGSEDMIDLLIKYSNDGGLISVGDSTGGQWNNSWELSGASSLFDTEIEPGDWDAEDGAVCKFLNRSMSEYANRVEFDDDECVLTPNPTKCSCLERADFANPWDSKPNSLALCSDGFDDEILRDMYNLFDFSA